MKTNMSSSLLMSRRQVIQAGVATLLGLAVRDLVAFGGTAHQPLADNVILLWLSGGMSHIDTFDPKPGREGAGDFKPIKTTASGIEISEILPKVAAQMKHAALIRSLTGIEGAHERAVYHVLSSYRPTPQIIHPSIGSVVCHEVKAGGDLPNFISIGGHALSAGYMGNTCDAYYIGDAGQPDPYIHLPEGVNEGRASRRMAALAQANNGFMSRTPDPQLNATTDSYQAAIRFMHSPALSAFNLEEETQQVRDSYGDTQFGRGCLLARRLIDKGVRFVQVSTGGFDTHVANFPTLRKLGSSIDPAIASLISDLAASGQLKRTLVITLSEFGRTPGINEKAGRDHHPDVFSSFIAGGGVKAGTLIGSSDPDGNKAATRPVTPSDVHASICYALGIDPEKSMDTPLGRPMKLVDGGKAIPELFGG